jgi:hypothetical protein
MSYAKEVEKSQNWEKLHSELNKKYNVLFSDNENVKKDYDILKKDHDKLKKDHDLVRKQLDEFIKKNK